MKFKLEAINLSYVMGDDYNYFPDSVIELTERFIIEDYAPFVSILGDKYNARRIDPITVGIIYGGEVIETHRLVPTSMAKAYSIRSIIVSSNGKKYEIFNPNSNVYKDFDIDVYLTMEIESSIAKIVELDAYPEMNPNRWHEPK
jgi:hypothetical protein